MNGGLSEMWTLLTERDEAVRLGRLTQAVLALVRTLETDPVAMED